MIIALYIRVSKEELHPENQELQLKKFCQEKNYDIFDIYTDIISGTKEYRPELTRLIQDAESKKFNAILIWKLDRLGRSLQHLIRIVNYLDKCEVDLICLTQNIDTTTSGGKLLFHIFGAIAEFERNLISERTKAGLERVREGGIVLGRPKGAKDRKERKKDGYFNRYRTKPCQSAVL